MKSQFSGHGKEEAGLVVLDNAGKPKPATGQALAGLFTQFPQIKCVLLNACYAEVQARAIVKHIDYVIGMKDTILDDAAIAFTTGFYDGLGYGRTIEDAFELGKNAILWELSSFSDTTRQMIPVDLATTESTASLPEDLKPILLKKGVNIDTNISIQPSQNVTSVTQDNSVQKYRERIKEYLADHILTPIEKFQLATLAKQSGISESEENNILQAELQQIEQAKKDYQTVLRQTIEQGYYPFNSQIQQQLKDLQGSLKLTDSEVADISQVILEEAEIQIRSKKFTFQVVTVDERGRESSSSIKEAELFAEDLGDPITLEMVKIPGGTFLMGTDDAEIARLNKIYNVEWFSRERPQHQVNVTSFLMGRYPITQSQWRIVAGWESIERTLEPDPSYFKEDYEGIDRWIRPVERISWDDAVEFCARLSHQSGCKYRLPTEAEWEYACRSLISYQSSVTSEELTEKEWTEKYHQPFHFGETISTELANYRGTDWEYKGKVYPGNYGGGSKGIYRKQTTPV
ncbi:MAG: formylglycine-generating enzyme family protein, partial [Waterburya sp.]